MYKMQIVLTSMICAHKSKMTISIRALSERSSGENLNFLNMYTGSIRYVFYF